MKRKTPPRRRTPLRKKNHKRKRRLYQEQFGEASAWIRTLPCCICRRPSTEDHPTTSSHVKGRGAGGKSDQQVPMCGACHTYYEGHKREWNERYNLVELAGALSRLWQQMQASFSDA